MIRTLIIDDEENNRIRLKQMIQENFQQIAIVGEADGVTSGLEAIAIHKPELLLLDIRTHKSQLINMSYIESFDKTEGGSVILKDNTHIPVSRRKKNELLEFFSKL
ncbi:MAG: response regulator transcription factor [Bacteroidota bacterium]|nr:response regulator transcription factor [Bacteroidota bacterium]